MKNFLLKTIFIFFPFFVFAQQRSIHNNQSWLQYYNVLQLSKRTYLASDISVRHIRSNYQLLIRTAYVYRILPELSGAAGFAYLGYPGHRELSIEIRPYIELATEQFWAKVKVLHRYRTEYRMFKRFNSDNSFSDVGGNFRFRYRILMQFPLLQLKNEKSILLLLGDELFLNASKQIYTNVLDNNRILCGVLWNSSLHFAITALFNYQVGQRNSSGYFIEHTSVFWLGITHKLIFKNLN